MIQQRTAIEQRHEAQARIVQANEDRKQALRKATARVAAEQEAERSRAADQQLMEGILLSRGETHGRVTKQDEEMFQAMKVQLQQIPIFY